ncbi:MAG: hypothetical protein ABI857_05965 [Acidobacteriota bacterium]
MPTATALIKTGNNVVWHISKMEEPLRVVFCEQETAGVSELFAQSRNYD